MTDVKIIWRTYGLRFAFLYKHEDKYWLRIVNTGNLLGKMIEYSKPLAVQPVNDEEAILMARELYKEKFDCDDAEIDENIKYFQEWLKGWYGND